MTRRRIACIALAACLLLYVGGYAVCRGARLLVHTSCVLNVDFHGRYHMVHRSGDSFVGHAAEFLFWPQREVETRWHGRGGRLD